jgi:hypothetical protein
MSYISNMLAARLGYCTIARDRRTKATVVEADFPHLEKPVSPCVNGNAVNSNQPYLGATFELAIAPGRGGRAASAALVQPDFLQEGLLNQLGLTQLVRLSTLITDEAISAAGGKVQRKEGSFGTHIAGVYTPPLLAMISDYDRADRSCIDDFRRVLQFNLSHCSPLAGFAHVPLLDADREAVVATVLEHGFGVLDDVVTDQSVALLVRMSMIVSVLSFVQANHVSESVHGIPSAITTLPGFSNFMWLLDPASPPVGGAAPSSAASTSTVTSSSSAPTTNASAALTLAPPPATTTDSSAMLAMLQTLKDEVQRLASMQTATLPPPVSAAAAPIAVPTAAIPGATAANPYFVPPVATSAPVFPSALTSVQTYLPSVLADARNGILPNLRALLALSKRQPLIREGKVLRLTADGGLTVDTSDHNLPVTNITQIRTTAEQLARLMNAIHRPVIANDIREDFVGATLETLERIATFATTLAYVRATYDALGTFIRTSTPGTFSFKFDFQLHAASNSDALQIAANRDKDGQAASQRPRLTMGANVHQRLGFPQQGSRFIGPPPTGPPPTGPPPRLNAAPPAPFAPGSSSAPCANYANHRPCAYHPCPFSH